ncbi:MAG: LamG domain-containing protein, partial [Lentisphaerota bacterium]
MNHQAQFHRPWKVGGLTSLGLGLFLLWTCPSQAQTIAGENSIRFPAALPFLNGLPNVFSVQVLAGGSVGGVAATNNIGATNYILKSSAFAYNVEHIAPNAYLGQVLAPPASTSGAPVNWPAMTNTTLISPPDGAFFEPSMKVIYAAVGGEVEITWKYTDGSQLVASYVVESAPAGRAYRVYWTDAPYNAPKVQLDSGDFVKFHYNSDITAPQYAVTTNANGIVGSNVVAGLYIDSSMSLNAVGGQQGLIVMQYFKTGAYSDQVSTGGLIVIEVMPPDIQTLQASMGERILPQGGLDAVDELSPQITAGLEGEEVYVYQHASSDGSVIPKMDWVFPIALSVDEPWNIEIYWKIPDLMGTKWFYEVDWYSANWPQCYNYVRGDGAYPGAPIYFPSNITPSLMVYQEPEGGCAVMQDPQTLTSTTNSGRCLVQLLSQDQNVWFLPIQMITRTDPQFDLSLDSWTIGNEIRPHDTARSAWFTEEELHGKIIVTNITLPGDFTLEGWFMPGNLETQTNTEMMLFDKQNANDQPWSNQVNLILFTGQPNAGGPMGTLQATIGPGGDGSVNPLVVLGSTNSLASFKWAHVALTLQGRQITLYINGAKDSSMLMGTNGTRITHASPLAIGARVKDGSRPFHGLIDNLRIWTNALSATQVQTAMMGNNNGYSVDVLAANGLAAYFPIDENDTLSAIHDLTGRYGAVLTNGLLPDVGAVGMSQSILYSEWHGYLYTPFGNSYNTNLYAYPNSAQPSAPTYIFGVNTNTALEVWWSEKILQPGLPAVYIPNWVERYRNVWPGPNESPYIILASGEGSKKGGIYEQGNCMATSPGGLPSGAILRPDEYFSGSFSMGLWLYLNSFPSNGHGVTFPLSFYNVSSNNSLMDHVLLKINSNAKEIFLVTANGTSGSEISAPIVTGQWVYVMASVDGSGMGRLYIDGMLAASSSLPLPNAVIRTNCLVGYNNLEPADAFDGLIDEVRIWSGVLTEPERLAAMINDAENMNTKDLVSYFSFDPYKGHLILDQVSGYKALLFNANSQAPGAPALGSRRYTPEERASIYYQNNALLPGYNPNEEHALLNREDGYDVAYAFRNDLNAPFSQSQPYVLVDYWNPLIGRPGMDVFEVVTTSRVFATFQQAATAGSELDGPHPLDLVPSHWTGMDIKSLGPAWEARTKAWFGLAGGAGPTDTATVVMHNYYPKQPSFWFPGIASNQQPATGTPIPWLPALAALDYTKSSYPTSGLPQAVTWTLSWPAAIPTLDAGATLTLAQDGLPDIWDQLSVDVVYQQSSSDATNTNNRSVLLFDPICARGATLAHTLAEYGFEQGGPNPSVYVRNGLYYFNGLPPELSERFYYNPALGSSNLLLIGQMIQPVAGDPYLLDNVLNDRQRAVLTTLVASNNPYLSEWMQAISLLGISAVELAPNQPFTGIALNAPGSGSGYVALAFNNATNPALGVSPSLPVSLSLLFVTTNLATGAAIPMEDPYNLLSEQMSMLFSLDFAGNPGNYVFDWRWTEPNPNGTTPSDPIACAVYTQAVGVSFLDLDGQSPQDLINRFFAVRYRAVSNTVASVVGTNWSEFTSFALAEGWVQRILNSLTPFEQRMRDLYNNPVETSISMIEQAGAPYEGDVALNQDNIEDVGLIQLYQTVQNRAEVIMDNTDETDADANQQLLLAASRLNDLYMLLGNEAYADAMDPTVGFGSSVLVNNAAVLPIDYGAYASSLFCFDNQVPSLLDEELALLRGRGNATLAPGMGLTPVYNRLYWNYTKGITAGEVAYTVNYDIAGHTNVIIDATTAKERFPQGHGDAWGYYLDSMGVYYKLLHHSTFDWGLPSISPMLMNDLTIDADYYDEKKFAESGAALSRAGLDVIRHTYRQSYSESGADLFPGYVDSNTNRAWGVGQWGARVGVGALCNWMVGNSFLPLPSSWLTNETSLALNGAGYAQCPDSSYFDGDFTLEMWINLQSHGASNAMNLMSFANADQTEMVLLELQATNRAPSLSIFTGGTQSVINAGAALATGQWVHVAAVLATNTASLYVNGALVQQASGQLTPATVLRTNNYLGLTVMADDVSFAGSLCEVRIWSGARTVDDIAGSMNRRLTGGEIGLVAYWPMSEGGGNSLLDRSYNGHIAQVEGASGWTDDMPALAVNYDYDDPGILKIDRTTVKALTEIADNMAAVQESVNNADRGLNPLGLARASIPFDISPSEIESGNTHFEQILARAEKALNNAGSVFEAAQESGRLLRQQQKGAYEFEAATAGQELDYKRQLIEIYGYPYSDDIGTGQTYSQGYDGPDVYHYMYVDMEALGWSGTEVQPISAHTYVFEGAGSASVLNPYGFDTNQPMGVLTNNMSNSITFYNAANGLPCKPTIWTGERRAEGRLQMAYGEFLQQLLVYREDLEVFANNT